jgi:hypothetical protein
MDYSLILTDFTRRTKAVLDYFTGKQPEKPPLTKQDCSDFRAFLGVLSHRVNSSLRYKHARYKRTIEDRDRREEVVAEFVLDKPEIDRADNNMAQEIERLTALEDPKFHTHKDMLLYWHQTNVEKGKAKGHTADRAIIKAISPKPLRVYFPKGAETLKHKMTDLPGNPFKKGFVVDVHVQYVGDMPALYTILDVHDVIDLDEEDDEPQGGLL